MIGKMVSIGFNLATLPARMAIKGVAKGTHTMLSLPAQYTRAIEQVRQASEEIAQELETVMAQMEAEIAEQTAHLSPEQKRQAAQAAFANAEQHLSQSAVELLRAFSLLSVSEEKLQSSPKEAFQRHQPSHKRKPIVIDHEDG